MKHQKDFTKQKQRHRAYARSTSQNKRQKKFKYCCNFWKNYLTQAQRLEWSKIAPHALTGYNYFLQINLVLTFNDMPVISDPPG